MLFPFLEFLRGTLRVLTLNTSIQESENASSSKKEAEIFEEEEAELPELLLDSELLCCVLLDMLDCPVKPTLLFFSQKNGSK